MWRNQIGFWSGNIGLFTAIASMASLTVGAAAYTYRNYIRVPIVVGEFSSLGTAKLANAGDFPILVKSIRLTSHSPEYDMMWEKSIILEPGKVESISLYRIALSDWKTDTRDALACGYKDQVLSLKPEIAVDLLSSTASEEHKALVIPEFLLRSSGEFRKWQEWSKEEISDYGADGIERRNASFECSGEIVFSSALTGRNRTAPLDCVGTFRLRGAGDGKNAACKKDNPGLLD